MSIQRLCRAFVLGTILFGGSILGMPMRPEEIENLMSSTSQPKIEMTITDEKDKDTEPGANLKRRRLLPDVLR